MSKKKQRPKLGTPVDLEKMSERDLAAALGVSTRWLWQARQVGDIPDEQFEAMVESDDPPTVTELVNVARRRDGSKRKREVCPHCGQPMPDKRKA